MLARGLARIGEVGGDDWRDKPAAEAGVTFDLGALIRRSMELVRPIGISEVGQPARSEETGQ